jgi:hypothetical protein
MVHIDSDSDYDQDSKRRFKQEKKKIEQSDSDSDTSPRKQRRLSNSSSSLKSTSESELDTEVDSTKSTKSSKHSYIPRKPTLLSNSGLLSTKSTVTSTRKSINHEKKQTKKKYDHRSKETSRSKIINNSSDDDDDDSNDLLLLLHEQGVKGSRSKLSSSSSLSSSSLLKSNKIGNKGEKKKVQRKQKTFTPSIDIVFTETVLEECSNVRFIFYGWIRYMWDMLICVDGTIDEDNALLRLHRSIRLLRKPGYFASRTFSIVMMPTEASESAYHAKLRNGQFYTLMNLLRSCDLLLSKTELKNKRYSQALDRLKIGLFCNVDPAHFSKFQELVRPLSVNKKVGLQNGAPEIDTNDENNKQAEGDEEEKKEELSSEAPKMYVLATNLLNKWLTPKQMSMLSNISYHDWIQDILLLLVETQLPEFHKYKQVVELHAERLLLMMVWMSNLKFNRKRTQENKRKQDALLEDRKRYQDVQAERMKLYNAGIFRIHSLCCEEMIRNTLFTRTLMDDSIIFIPVKIKISRGDQGFSNCYLKVNLPYKINIGQFSYYYPMLDAKGFIRDGIDHLLPHNRDLTTFDKSVNDSYHQPSVQQFQLDVKFLSTTATVADVYRNFDTTAASAQQTYCYKWNKHLRVYRDKIISTKAELIRSTITTGVYNATSVIESINELKTITSNINIKVLEEDAKGEAEEISRLTDLIYLTGYERAKTINTSTTTSTNTNVSDNPDTDQNTIIVLPNIESVSSLSSQVVQKPQFQRLISNFVELQLRKSLVESVLKSQYTEFIQLNSQLPEIIKWLTHNDVTFARFGMYTKTVIDKYLFGDMHRLHEECHSKAISEDKTEIKDSHSEGDDSTGHSDKRPFESLSYDEKYKFAFQSMCYDHSPSLVDAYRAFVEINNPRRDYFVSEGFKFEFGFEGMETILIRHREKFGHQSLMTLDYQNQLCLQLQYPKDIIILFMQYVGIKIIDPLNYMTITYETGIY